MPRGYPSPRSVRVERLASEEFIHSYTRNQDSFALPSYSQAIPVEQRSDLYLRLDDNNASRILGPDGEDFTWPIGNDRPDGKWNLDDFDFQNYMCKRKAFNFRLPIDTIEAAEWDIVGSETRSKAQQAMTARSLSAIVILNTEANFSNKKTTWTPKWDAGTVADPKFLDGLLEMYSTIFLATQGSVSPSDIVVVLNPDDARLIATSAEIREYVKYFDNSKVNQEFFSGSPAFVRNFGLPAEYGGFTLRVEDTVINTTPKAAPEVSATKAFAFEDDKAVMLCRPNGPGGGVEGNAADKTRLATLTVFEKENMNVELFDTENDIRLNRVMRGSIVDDVAVELTSPISAFYASGFMT